MSIYCVPYNIKLGEAISGLVSCQVHTPRAEYRDDNGEIFDVEEATVWHKPSIRLSTGGRFQPIADYVFKECLELAPPENVAVHTSGRLVIELKCETPPCGLPQPYIYMEELVQSDTA